MSNIFGFACTSVRDVQKICEGVIGREKVQVMSGRDSVANRRCYVVMGVSSLGPPLLLILARCRGVLVVLDSPPALRRVRGMRVLDCAEGHAWRPTRPDVAPLRRALRARPESILTGVSADDTVSILVADVRSRGILDKVLAAARPMSPLQRTQLHAEVCRHLAGRMALSTVIRRAAATRIKPSLVESLREALSSDVAARISVALRAVLAGSDPVLEAAANRVDPSELRFIASHLRRPETIK